MVKTIKDIIKEEIQDFVTATDTEVDTDTETYLNDNFWKWFGNSKVVNPDGSPMIVYHGTGTDFNVFEKGDIGFHFGTKKAAVSRLRTKKIYGEKRLFKGVYLKIENPLRMPDMGGWGADYVANELVRMKILKPDDLDVNTKWKELTTKYGYNKTSNWNYEAANRELRKYVVDKIKEKGYDGIRYINNNEDKGSLSWVVFEPMQIKSAEDNNGEFSSTNPDITKEGVTDTNAVLKEQTKIYNLQNLADIAAKQSGYDRDILLGMLQDAFREGDEEVKELFQGMVGAEIFIVSRGRYSFAEIFEEEENVQGIDNSFVDKVFNAYFEEGVADKYAEKQFNIPDTTATADVKARGELQKEEDKPAAYVQDGAENVSIYKNPISLSNFDNNVRAISDDNGDLYVAQKNGFFNHGKMGNVLFPELGKWVISDTGVYASPNKYVLLQRIGEKNKFGLSDSSAGYAEREPEQKIIDNLLLKAERKNPQYDFYNEYYQDLEDDTLSEFQKEIQNIVREEIIQKIG
jgi:hypothetical protein